jgi:hypothetical protein
MSSYLLRRAAGAPSTLRAFSTSSSRSLARISIIGNLGGPPELATAANGQEYIKYVVASNTGPAANRVVSWFNVTKFLDSEKRGKDFMLGLQKGYVNLPDSPSLLQHNSLPFQKTQKKPLTANWRCVIIEP